MSAKPQYPNDPTADKVETPDVTAVAKLMHKNVERLADLQKATLDAFNRQSTEVTETMRKSFKTSPGTPSAAWLDFAEKGMNAWINAQKSVVDLIVDQSAQTVKFSGEGTQSLTKFGEMWQQGIERTTAVQKTMLDFASQQYEAVSKAFAGPTTGPAAEITQAMQKNVTNFVDQQKEFLDKANQFTKEAVAAGKN